MLRAKACENVARTASVVVGKQAHQQNACNHHSCLDGTSTVAQLCSLRASIPYSLRGFVGTGPLSIDWLQVLPGL